MSGKYASIYVWEENDDRLSELVEALLDAACQFYGHDNEDEEADCPLMGAEAGPIGELDG